MHALRSLTLVGLAAASLAGACLPIRGDSIAAEDLAPVIPVFGQAQGHTLSPAPLAGAERRFSHAELLQLARRLGLPASEAASFPETVCFAYAVAVLTPEQVTASIRRAAGSGAAFELTEYSLFPVPAGELVFRNVSLRPDRPDGTKLLTGSIAYALRRQTPVWARVRPLAKPRGLIAAQDLRPGLRLEAAHFRMGELTAGTPSYVSSATEIEGLTPRRRIAAGTPLLMSMLMRSLDVGPGDAVSVRVQAGAAHLAFETLAETGGYTGDQIVLKNPVSGQRFRAKVEGHARAFVDLSAKENPCCR